MENLCNGDLIIIKWIFKNYEMRIWIVSRDTLNVVSYEPLVSTHGGEFLQ